MPIVRKQLKIKHFPGRRIDLSPFGCGVLSDVLCLITDSCAGLSLFPLSRSPSGPSSLSSAKAIKKMAPKIPTNSELYFVYSVLKSVNDVFAFEGHFLRCHAVFNGKVCWRNNDFVRNRVMFLPHTLTRHLVQQKFVHRAITGKFFARRRSGKSETIKHLEKDKKKRKKNWSTYVWPIWNNDCNVSWKILSMHQTLFDEARSSDCGLQLRRDNKFSVLQLVSFETNEQSIFTHPFSTWTNVLFFDSSSDHQRSFLSELAHITGSKSSLSIFINETRRLSFLPTNFFLKNKWNKKMSVPLANVCTWQKCSVHWRKFLPPISVR